ncbi:hypothetical protein SAMN04489760_104176 [Syntrophus gentianae]|uniref:Uncharacterized protein n=1 Tax=Syntrophus gentianae TaxID=43775 RepID=A0A1H7VU47_9BACT|nr:hypothetical protein [Syntrophus gentianae]SEM12298.1 hypothetical protein SAMN04489760_104176 [Syntrophus gentianae]
MRFMDSMRGERWVKDQKKLVHQKQRIENELDLSPTGKAREAKSAGIKIFQIDLPINKPKGDTALIGALKRRNPQDYRNVIKSIEEEGWRFDHVSCVYCITDNAIKGKILSSGQEETRSNEIFGSFIFRES